MENPKVTIEKKFIIDCKLDNEDNLTLKIKKIKFVVNENRNTYAFNTTLLQNECKLAKDLVNFILRGFLQINAMDISRNTEMAMQIFDFVKNMYFEEFKEKDEIEVCFDFKYLTKYSNYYSYSNKFKDQF